MGLRAGLPTLIIALALDQYFYGRMDHRLNLGPKPLYIRKRLCTVQEIREALADLLSGRYDAPAKDAAGKIRQENGIEQAAEAIENYVSAGIVNMRPDGILHDFCLRRV